MREPVGIVVHGACGKAGYAALPVSSNRASHRGKTRHGGARVYEVKHDGYRLMDRKDGERVRIYIRRGANWTGRLPRIVEAVEKLRVRSVLFDAGGSCLGLANFDLLLQRTH
jgi:ATP-dependent DNA ligase